MLKRGLGKIVNKLAREHAAVISQNHVIDCINTKYQVEWRRLNLSEFAEDKKKKLKDIWLELDTASALNAKSKVPSEFLTRK